ARIVANYRKNGVSVSLVVPPVAPTVRDLLAEGGRYRYIDELRARLHELDVPLADFHDAGAIPATDCEFVDGYHAGDITYLKMLAGMVRAWPWLAPLVDMRAVELTIATFDGNIIDQSAPERFRGLPELDFMEMGCNRRPSPGGGRAA
ncbi:MAG TPA: hypothetical protein VHN20_14680, partial [Beijerinckiaceae bacterium]|nr:hypothetical protein [Beijerinckiaceae bacterium]